MVLPQNYTEEKYYGTTTESGCTDRVKKLMAMMHDLPNAICLHRSRCFTKVYKENWAQPDVIKKAMAVCETLDTLPLLYNEGELIVGVQATKNKAFPIHPEIETGWILQEGGLKGISERRYSPYYSTEEEQKEFAEDIAPFWKDKCLLAKYSNTCPEEIQDKIFGTYFGGPEFPLSVLGSHLHLDWQGILEKGTNSYKEYAIQKKSELDMNDLNNFGKDKFYDAVVMVLEAMERFSHRWADYMKSMAETVNDPALRKEYLEIAEICDRVPHEPARNFREALQSLWFTECCFYNDSTGPYLALGRMDQYMYKYYEQDKANGYTREYFMELLELFYLKLNNDFTFWDVESAQHMNGTATFQNILVGGVDEYGRNAENELSYLFIDSIIDAHILQPALCVRVNNVTSDKFLLKAMDLVAAGMGFPSFFNDGPCIAVTRSYGHSLKEAYDYSCSGCEDISYPGSYIWGPGQWVNLGMACELALHDGIKPANLPGRKAGERISVSTGDPRNFKTFEEYMDAVKMHIKRQMDLIYISSQHIAEAYQSYPLIIQSTFMNSCLDRGLPTHSGGLKSSSFPGYDTVGMADIADHCAAVKKLVFDEKVLTMDELIKALDANFEGYEDIRQMCLACPKFGNDDDYVDLIEQDVIDFFTSYVQTKPGIYSKRDPEKETAALRHKCGASTSPVSGNIPFGIGVGALASGRKAGEPLGDAAGAYMGMDKNGPTAAINSYGKVDNYQITGGNTINMYLNSSCFDSVEGKMGVVALLRSAFLQGIEHLQFNVMDKGVLLDAQKNPEKYPTLMIRVSGYSAYFVELDKSVQDVIIDRTLHTV